MYNRQLTFQDIMMWYRSQTIEPIINFEDDSIAKAMVNIGMGTGVWNPIYGSQAWYQLNTESNWFGIMPKLKWDKSGFRIITSFTRTASAMGIPETGALPTPTAPTIQIVKLVPKIMVNTFQTSQVTELLARNSMDDIYGNLDTIRQYYMTEHIKLSNEALSALAVGDSVSTSVSGAGLLTYESIDRIVSSYAEGTGVGLSSTTTPTLAQVINPWNGAIDRSQGPSALDAVVISASGTFGTPAPISDGLIRELIQNTRYNGAYSNVFVTGYNTYADIQGLYMSSWRTFNWGEMMVHTGLNGIETATGVDTGVKVATMYGIPLIQAVNTPTEPNGTKERLYLLDTTDAEGYGDARLGMQILWATTYMQTTDRDFLLLNQLAYMGAYVTIGELQSRFPGSQGKLRDLQ